VEPIPATGHVLEQLFQRGEADLAVTLLTMGRRARELVPECVGLSLALLKDGLTLTVVATSESIAGLDAVQYLDGGPCVDAAHEERAVHVSDISALAEDKWLMFAQATAARGVVSSLTLPILEGSRVIGTVNLYAATSSAFEDKQQALGDALDASAEYAVTNADLSFDTLLEAEHGPQRLADEDDIAIALGLIAASQDVSMGTAEERLRAAASRAGITEGQAARAVRGHPRSSG
jgi:transcriptional regulator with GAF, ATPase, and Fis domain